jgi:UDP-N-acetylglucosamine--N-acetylmuramyl-(pentapeptide) pyrophosphoryl-undecaprenol N-acetylglucosamine transferase
MNGRPRVLLCAGGTGGHLFPAEALAGALKRLDVEVALATDRRAGALAGSFPAEEVIEIASATPSGGSPLGMEKAALFLGYGFLQASSRLRRRRPAAVVGFGGYPTLPPLMAAVARRVPTVIHEANAVAGRANRFLAGRVTAIATSFETTGLLGEAAVKAVVTGNPVRPRVVAAAAPFTVPSGEGPLRLLVFGGSQGARSINLCALDAFAGSDAAERDFHVLHISGSRDYAEALERLRGAGAVARYTLLEYEPDLADSLAACDLVLARAGGSIFEIAAAARPAILVPYPHAAGRHQHANAEWMVEGGAAVAIEDAELEPVRLRELTAELLGDRDRLATMAAASAALARPDAAELIAAEVLAAIREPSRG